MKLPSPGQIVGVIGAISDVVKWIIKLRREDKLHRAQGKSADSMPLGDRDVIIQLDAARNAGKKK